MNKRWCLIVRAIEANDDELQLLKHRLDAAWGLQTGGTIVIADWIMDEHVEAMRRRRPEDFQPRQAGSRQGSRIGSRTRLPQ